MNFSDWYQTNYSVHVGENYKVELLLDSDNQIYSGKTPDGKTDFTYINDRLEMNIPPFSGRIFLLKNKQSKTTRKKR